MSLFHITSAEDLAQGRRAGQLEAESLGAQGFIHGCYRSQLLTVAELVFPEADSLLVVELDRRLVGSPVIDEGADPTIEGSPDELFPHVYGPIAVAAILAEHIITRGPEGFTLPGALRSPPSAARLEQLLARFDWYDHPEGMRFVETDRNAYRTHGHWLFRAGARSKFHRVKDSDELWLVHEGRLLVHVIAPDGGLESRVLGLGPGEAATLSVPAGHWQAAELPPGEDYAFGSNVCAPPFTFEDSLEIADGGLTEKYPMHRPLIERLT